MWGVVIHCLCSFLLFLLRTQSHIWCRALSGVSVLKYMHVCIKGQSHVCCRSLSGISALTSWDEKKLDEYLIYRCRYIDWYILVCKYMRCFWHGSHQIYVMYSVYVQFWPTLLILHMVMVMVVSIATVPRVQYWQMRHTYTQSQSTH